VRSLRALLRWSFDSPPSALRSGPPREPGPRWAVGKAPSQRSNGERRVRPIALLMFAAVYPICLTLSQTGMHAPPDCSDARGRRLRRPIRSQSADTSRPAAPEYFDNSGRTDVLVAG
jgi:hypothetical protein